MDIFEADAQQKEEEFHNWWNENWKSIIGGIAAALVVITAFWVYRDYRNEQRQTRVADFYTTVFEVDISSEEVQKRVAQYAEENTSVLGQLAAVKLSKAEIAAGKTEKALDLLKSSLGRGDKILDDVVRLRIARLEAELGRYDDATAVLNDVKEDTFAKAVAEVRGDVLLASGNRTGALEQYKKALELGDGTASAKVLQMKHDSLLENPGVAPLNLGAEVSAPKADAQEKQGEVAQENSVTAQDSAATKAASQTK